MDPRTIDLNADLGEGFPNDVPLLARVTSASLACGAHAGDRETIVATLREAKRQGVIVGAHPGYADRAGFGRREQSMAAVEVECLIFEQVTYLRGLAETLNLPVRYVKPHGALYNLAQQQDEVALGVAGALSRLGLPVVGQPASALERRARDQGVRYITEGFPDRRYRDDSRLVPRGETGAILHEPAEIEAQVVRLVEMGVETLCIHGDDPRAVTNADTVRAILEHQRIALRPFV